MFEGYDHTIEEIIRRRRLLSPAQLESAHTAARASGQSLADAVCELAMLEKPALLRAVAEHLGAAYAENVPSALPEEMPAVLTGELARDYGAVPWRTDAGSVDLLVVDPFNRHIVDDLSFVLGREVRLTVADPAQVAALVRRHYGDDGESLEEAALELAAQADGLADRTELSDDDVAQLAGRAPIIHFVNLVLSQTIRDHASDVHFEPFEREFKIRSRIDGVLHEMPPPPLTLVRPVISRLKVLANLDIAERRLPQDGRIKLAIAGRAVDLRVSTLPTQFGESVVLRVLDQSAVRLELSDLGLPPATERDIREIIRRPNGIFLVTGPTGSGKTTTLYSSLKLLNSAEVKILTVEDPVEYEIEGIMQVPVNPGAELGFPRALRSFLRQDPDIVMVGEIRDLETAQIAIQAALTGHLVLSTLHTNDAPGAITRLTDMGVEPFLLASTVEAVLAQRLVRRICPECKAARLPETTTLRQLGFAPAEFGDRPTYFGKGCPHCAQTGYRGRLGIFEFLRLNDELRDLIVAGTPLAQLRKRAGALGLTSLRAAGLQAVLAGETTPEEVAKYV
ncbi:MAG: type II/IV secretion system protein [Opitutae bacterium]|nr:type II/IV secretion system protein [Opitutae bacterium]